MRIRFAPVACLTLLTLLLLTTPAIAKEKKPDKKMDPQQMMEIWKQMAQPGEPHKLFAGLAGSWTTATKEWMEPDGGQMKHRAVWKIVDPNTQTFEMYGTHHGGKEAKVLEITYTRKAS
ncbi:MAG: hypothetical protein NTNFB02_30190 [Nitrospira sp.]